MVSLIRKFLLLLHPCGSDFIPRLIIFLRDQLMLYYLADSFLFLLLRQKIRLCLAGLLGQDLKLQFIYISKAKLDDLNVIVKNQLGDFICQLLFVLHFQIILPSLSLFPCSCQGALIGQIDLRGMQFNSFIE